MDGLTAHGTRHSHQVKVFWAMDFGIYSEYHLKKVFFGINSEVLCLNLMAMPCAVNREKPSKKNATRIISTRSGTPKKPIQNKTYKYL
jgi:hypothetical protein